VRGCGETVSRGEFRQCERAEKSAQWEMRRGLLIGCGKVEFLVHSCGKRGAATPGAFSFAPLRGLLLSFRSFTHGSRRGLHSFARYAAGLSLPQRSSVAPIRCWRRRYMTLETVEQRGKLHENQRKGHCALRERTCSTVKV
jgi:hypothetical protein